jgi:hypothetical protein
VTSPASDIEVELPEGAPVLTPRATRALLRILLAAAEREKEKAA